MTQELCTKMIRLKIYFLPEFILFSMWVSFFFLTKRKVARKNPRVTNLGESNIMIRKLTHENVPSLLEYMMQLTRRNLASEPQEQCMASSILWNTNTSQTLIRVHGSKLLTDRLQIRQKLFPRHVGGNMKRLQVLPSVLRLDSRMEGEMLVPVDITGSLHWIWHLFFPWNM